MGKVITTRYEYATYDDADPTANLAGNPPSYPPMLDQYGTTTTGTAAAGYGVINIGSSGAAQTLFVPAGANITLVGDAANTTMLALSIMGNPAPGAGTISMVFLCGPGQTVSVPGVCNAGASNSVYACTVNGSASSNVAFKAQLLWSL